MCMEVNPETMTSADLCPEGSTALDLAVEAKQLRNGVCSNLLGEYFCNSREQTDGSKVANVSLMDTSEYIYKVFLCFLFVCFVFVILLLLLLLFFIISWLFWVKSANSILQLLQHS